jgi:hypothetical protein
MLEPARCRPRRRSSRARRRRRSRTAGVSPLSIAPADSTRHRESTFCGRGSSRRARIPVSRRRPPLRTGGGSGWRFLCRQAKPSVVRSYRPCFSVIPTTGGTSCREATFRKGLASLSFTLTPNPSPNAGRGESVGASMERVDPERPARFRNERAGSPLPALGEGLGVRVESGTEDFYGRFCLWQKAPSPARPVRGGGRRRLVLPFAKGAGDDAPPPSRIRTHGGWASFGAAM